MLIYIIIYSIDGRIYSPLATTGSQKLLTGLKRASGPLQENIILPIIRKLLINLDIHST